MLLLVLLRYYFYFVIIRHVQINVPVTVFIQTLTGLKALSGLVFARIKVNWLIPNHVNVVASSNCEISPFRIKHYFV